MTTERAREGPPRRPGAVTTVCRVETGEPTDELTREVRGKLVARLKRKPELLRSNEHARELADHLVPTVLAYLADELTLAAEMFKDCAEGPEEVGASPTQSWPQGVRFAAESLLKRASAIRPPRRR